MTFSVDGPDAIVHDKIRRRIGSFERATRAIRLSIEAGIPTHMISVIWRESVQRVSDIVALAEKLAVQRLLLFSCGEIGAAVENREELMVDPEVWRDYLFEVRELARTRPWVWFELDKMRRADLPQFLPADYAPVCTRKQRDSITIDPLGDVYPCGYFIPAGKRLGNVQDAPLSELAFRKQEGERHSGACRDPFTSEKGFVELCKLISVNSEALTYGGSHVR
jgi:MoaA/NifB/PqqE/SkfB family radical SAM enzyme